MNSFVSNIRDAVQKMVRGTVAFYRKNRLAMLSGITIFSIILIVWARLGFTFEIGRFFAAETPSPATLSIQCSGSTAVLTWNIPANANSNTIQKYENNSWSQIFTDSTLTTTTYTDTTGTAGVKWRHKSGANVASNEVSCGGTGIGTGNAPASPVVLSAQCSATQNILTWTANTSGNPISIIRNVDGANGVFIAQNLAPTATTYTDTQVSSGHTYDYAVKNSPTARSNTVQCADLAATATPTATPVPTPTATPISSPTPTPTPILTPTASPSLTPTPTPVPTLTPTPTPTPIVVVTPTPTPGTPGTVQTGPGDAVFAALLVSGITTLLYVSYTNSSLFRRREIDALADHKDPMDFRT